MNLCWLEQTEADVPAENDWLSASECVCLNTMRFAKRRADWRLGRWTGKQALCVALDLPAHFEFLKKIEIRPAPSGAPVAFFASQPAAVAISLSHRAGRAACAVASTGVDIGCDLEVIEPRSEAFVADYFTSEEQKLVASVSASDRDRLLALLWSAKESALKALREGLRLDTRSVSVDLSAASLNIHIHGWNALQVGYAGGEVFHGWWQNTDHIIRTAVASPPPDPPILLKSTKHLFDTASSSA
jgi:4'-phosphopantetheinyl transferase